MSCFVNDMERYLRWNEIKGKTKKKIYGLGSMHFSNEINLFVFDILLLVCVRFSFCISFASLYDLPFVPHGKGIFKLMRSDHHHHHRYCRKHLFDSFIHSFIYSIQLVWMNLGNGNGGCGCDCIHFFLFAYNSLWNIDFSR